jgi:hypothetical protein
VHSVNHRPHHQALRQKMKLLNTPSVDYVRSERDER